MHHPIRLRRLAIAVTFAFAVVAQSSITFAQTGPDLLIKPWPKGQRVDAEGAITLLDNGHTNRASELQMTFYDTSGRVRLFPDERADPRFGWDLKYIHLDTNDPALPSKLVDTSVAFGMGVADQDGWLAGITAAIGYAAAGGFDDGNGYYAKADFAIGKELSETDAIGFVIDYDGNRTLMPDVPLPGFEYRKRLDTTLLLAVGFPFSSITWKPNEKLTIDAKYVFPDDAEARVDYEVIPDFALFASYGARYEAFHSDDLPNGRDRLIFQQRRFEGGVRWGPWSGASVIGAIGYAYSQEFNVGFDSRDQDRVAKPSDEPYLRFAFELRY
jgi:hypothetical protein